jgi:hypothetical protein
MILNTQTAKNFSLRPAQLSASRFLEKNSQAILIAPVGWGKTLTYINAAINIGGKVVVGVSEYEAVPDVVATIKALRPDATVVCPVGQTKTKPCSCGGHKPAFIVKQGEVVDRNTIGKGCIYHKLIAAIPSADFVVTHHAFIREHVNLFAGFDTLVLDEFDEALKMKTFLFARYRVTGKHINYEDSDFDVILEGLKSEGASTREPLRIKSINRAYNVVRNMKMELFANTITDVEKSVEHAINEGEFEERFRPNAVHLSLEEDAKRWAKLAVFTAPELSFLNYYPSTRSLYEVLKNVKRVTYICKCYSPNYADFSGYIEVIGWSSDTSMLNAGFRHVWLISATEPPFQLEELKGFQVHRVKRLDIHNWWSFVTSYSTDDELSELLEELKRREMNTVFMTRKKMVEDAKKKFKLDGTVILHFGKKTRSVNLNEYEALVIWSPEEREDRILPPDNATVYYDAIARKVLQAMGRIMRYPFNSYKLAVIPKRYLDEVKELAPYYRYVDLHACPLPSKGTKKKNVKVPILLHAGKGGKKKGGLHASVGADGRLTFRPPKGYEIVGGEIIIKEVGV